MAIRPSRLRGCSQFYRGLIPGFAKGGMHDGGLRMVGEKGPEIEATGPARYWTASQMANAIQGQQGTSTVTVELSPELVGKVLDQAKQQSVQISQKAVGEGIRLNNRAQADQQYLRGR